MAVIINNWNGENKDSFRMIVQEILETIVKDVMLHVPHNHNHEPIYDECFHIFIWSSPKGNNTIDVPEKIWDVKVNCRDEAFAPSGWGIEIRDNDYVVAELIDYNLYIHHDICHCGTEEELAIFRKILEKVIELIPSPEERWAKMSIPQKIKLILSQNFVFSDEMARILSLAFTGKKNAIIFGPGGHGKSAMVKAVIDGLGLADETFFQFFGEGMDESRLFGGLNFQKLEEEKILEYYPERSFLNYRIAVFEELFDAPANVLLALKDVLTARELRNGSQRFKMKTEVILVLTNKDPDEISELGPAAHALVERFPLQLDLRWKDYSAKSYLAMFDKVAKRLGEPELNGSRAILAEILAKATAEGNFISPRTAVHAYETIQAAAKIRGGNEVQPEDFVDLRFIAGLENLGESLEKDIKAARIRTRAKAELSQAEKKFDRLEEEFNEADTPIKILQVAKKLMMLEDKVAEIKVPDSLIERRDNLRETISNQISEAKSRALKIIHI